jgi:integrase
MDLRGRTWWFKRAIPAAVRDQFGGRTAYVKSLETGDLALAMARRDELERQTTTEFRDAASGRLLASRDQTDALARHWAEERRHHAADPIEWSYRVTGKRPQREEDALSPDEMIEAELEQLIATQGEQAGTRFVDVLHNRVSVEDPLEQHLKEADLTPKSKAERRQAVGEFAKWARGRSRDQLQSVDRRLAAEFFEAHVRERHPKTAGKRRSNLKQYWDWLIERGHYKGANHWEALKLVTPKRHRTGDPSGPKKERAFSTSEMRTLLFSEPPSGMRGLETLHDAMRVAALSGMRIEEICRLRVQDCEGGTFRVVSGKTRSAIREVPVHPDLQSIVDHRMKHKDASDRLFSDVRGRGEKLSDPLSKQFGRYSRKLKVAVVVEGQRRSLVNFHSFRRWFVTMAEQAGQPPHTISALVGHAEGRPGMTLGVYSAGPSGKQLRACVEAVKLPTPEPREASDVEPDNEA